MNAKGSQREIILKKISVVFILTLIFLVISVTGIGSGATQSAPDNTAGQTNIFHPAVANAETADLKIHFLDVGQADCILIQEPSGKTMLIDAGNNEDATMVTNCIRNLGITKIDVLIGTHPHEDHIGGMDAVINEFDIGTIILPDVTTTTLTFQDVLTAIETKGYAITRPVSGATGTLGSVSYQILAPNSTYYSDLNNYSVCLRMVYGNTSFLFMGDADTLVENEILNKGYDVSSTVLKVAHHGSDTSTSVNFLNAVAPKYAVISVGVGNIYGHPAATTLSNLLAKGVTIFRTDQLGTIIATSNGTGVTFNKSGTSVTLSPPTSFKAVSSGYSSIKTSWAAVTGATGYQVYRATSSTGIYTYIGTTTGTSFSSTGLTIGKTYYYKVRATAIIDGVKKYSGYSSVASAKPALAIPGSFKAASYNYNSVKVSWTAVSGASGYQVFRATSSTGTYSYLKATTSLSTVNTSLTTGKTYYYKVRGYRIVGTTKYYSAKTAVKSAKPVPAKPTSVKATTVSTSSLKVSWAAVSGASGYQVFRATSSTGTYAYVKGTAGLYWTNTGLSSGKYYYYKVRAYRTVGTTKVYGPTSAIVYAKTSTSTSTGTIVYITASGTKYHLSTCSYLTSSKIAISLSSAKAQGYTPCSRCNPPN